MKSKGMVWTAVVFGIVFVAIAAVYWTTSAGSLPSFFPGYASGSSVIHLKHGIASLLLGLALFVYAWFASGKKPPSSEKK